MRRSRVRRSKDRKVFKRTAVKSKTINLSPITMRGGTRL